MVPTASSWPSWPTYKTVYPLPARTFSSWWTLVTRGHTASTTTRPRSRAALDDLGGRSVRREHERGAVGHLVHVVDEDHPSGPELVHDVSVVDDLVVAVHRRLEDPDHPRQGLDGLLDSGTETSGRGQQDTLDRHLPRLPARCRRTAEADRS